MDDGGECGAEETDESSGGNKRGRGDETQFVADVHQCHLAIKVGPFCNWPVVNYLNPHAELMGIWVKGAQCHLARG